MAVQLVPKASFLKLLLAEIDDSSLLRSMMPKSPLNIICHSQVFSQKYKAITSTSKPGSSPSWRGICNAFAQLQGGFQQQQNRYSWRLDPQGKYTVASAYDYLNGIEDHNNRENFWNKIWELKGPTRGNYLLWNIAHEALPTQQFLHERHIVDDPKCAFCDAIEESALHAIRDCSWAADVWNLCVPKEDQHEFYRARTTVDWIKTNLESKSRLWKYTWKEATYGIWYWRNKLYHGDDEERPSPPRFVAKIVDRVRNLRLAWCIE